MTDLKLIKPTNSEIVDKFIFAFLSDGCSKELRIVVFILTSSQIQIKTAQMKEEK